MMKRESLLGFRTPSNPGGLIYPVVFSDGEHFPSEAQQIQQKDLRNWNISSLVFRETRDYAEFEKQVQIVAQEISQMLETVPDWREDWPVVTPDNYTDVTTPVPIQLPRLQ